MTDEGKKAARALADAVNSYSMNPKQFAEELCHNTHRTLQQQCFVLFAECIKASGTESAARLADNVKQVGFRYATTSGTTISTNDIRVPQAKFQILQEAERVVTQIEDQYENGLITVDERYSRIVDQWTETTDKVAGLVSDSLDRHAECT